MVHVDLSSCGLQNHDMSGMENVGKQSREILVSLLTHTLFPSGPEAHWLIFFLFFLFVSLTCEVEETGIARFHEEGPSNGPFTDS